MLPKIDDIITIVNHVGGTFNCTRTDQFIVFSAKPVKITTRLFVYVTDTLGKRWFAKISLEDDERLKREDFALQQISTRCRGSTLEKTVPMLYGYRHSIFVQEFLDGVPFSKLTGHHDFGPPWKSQLQQRCLNVIEWLVEFHALQTNAKRFDRLSNTLPQGMVHGDFKPSNILIGKENHLQVIDWELFEENGVQIYDLFHFLTYFVLTNKGGNRVEAFKHGLIYETWLSQFIGELVRKYCVAFNISVEVLREAYLEYLRFVLERRVKLGLSNKGHFMKEIQDYCQRCQTLWNAFQ